ncbi:DNA polymerase [Myxococcus sp. Y35]|uniref:DNA polymerase n=1 Tax=Pseudomyxococcus flavus TaxID=3115648 RepID=UPI003CFA48BE
MNEEDLQAHLGVLLSRTLTRLRRRPRAYPHTALVGVSVKWDEEHGTPLLVQFVTLTGEHVHAQAYDLPEGRLTGGQLIDCIREVLRRADAVPPARRGIRQVHVVTHEASSLLALFPSAVTEARVEQVGKAHHGRLERVKRDEGTWDVRLVDVSSYFPKIPLEEIARTVGLRRLDVDGPHLAELKRTDPARLVAHAARDAEVPLRAMRGFRESVLREWNIDVLGSRTLPSIASAIFRLHFARSGPAPVKKQQVVRKVRKGVTFRDEPRVEQVFDGDPRVRTLACRAYWGAQSEAFRRGFHVGAFAEYDAVSLYPHAALLQPLPHARTRWERLESLAQVQDYEGFGTFNFVFPEDTRYPCLPVHRQGVHRLVFPFQGTTSCTLAEVRLALRMGAKVALVEAHGFKPGSRERDHDVGRYMRHFLQQKGAAKRGSLEYATAKLFANALLGKLAERMRSSGLLDFEREAQLRGFGPGLGAAIHSSPGLRAALKGPHDVGSAFAPEWATLILGRARAHMADITSRGALLVSTDAIICPEELDLRCEGLDALESVGSGMRLEHRADAVFIARARLYALLQKVENVRPGEPVLGADDTWAVVRVARQGTSESEKDFAQTLLACLREGRDVAPTRIRKRRLTAEAAVREHKPIHSVVEEEVRTGFSWDGKRRLRDRDCNLFTQSTDTMPYQTLARLEAGERQRQVQERGVRLKKSRVPVHKVEKALALLRSGKSVRAVAKELELARATVGDIKKRAGVGPVQSGEGGTDE